MREIKFRVWDYRAFEYIDSFAFEDYAPLNDLMNAGFYVFEQYTGLKDKNGVEIYEGDILEGFSQKGTVIFTSGCFNIAQFYCSSFDYPTMSFSENLDFTIIGNIHENKELLK